MAVFWCVVGQICWWGESLCPHHLRQSEIHHSIVWVVIRCLWIWHEISVVHKLKKLLSRLTYFSLVMLVKQFYCWIVWTHRSQLSNGSDHIGGHAIEIYNLLFSDLIAVMADYWFWHLLVNYMTQMRCLYIILMSNRIRDVFFDIVRNCYEMHCRYYLLAGAFRRWKTSTKSIAAEQVKTIENIQLISCVKVLYELNISYFLAVAKLKFRLGFSLEGLMVCRSPTSVNIGEGEPADCTTNPRRCLEQTQRLPVPQLRWKSVK